MPGIRSGGGADRSTVGAFGTSVGAAATGAAVSDAGEADADAAAPGDAAFGESIPGIRTGDGGGTLASLRGVNLITEGLVASSLPWALVAMSLASSAIRSSDFSWSDICCGFAVGYDGAPSVMAPRPACDRGQPASHHTNAPEL